MRVTYAPFLVAVVTFWVVTSSLGSELEQWINKTIPMDLPDDECLNQGNEGGCPACTTNPKCHTCALRLGVGNQSQLIGMYVGCRSKTLDCNGFTTYPMTAAMFKSTEGSPASVQEVTEHECNGTAAGSQPTALIDITECDKCPGLWCDVVAFVPGIEAHGMFCVRSHDVCNMAESMKPQGFKVRLVFKHVSNEDCAKLEPPYIRPGPTDLPEFSTAKPTEVFSDPTAASTNDQQLTTTRASEGSTSDGRSLGSIYSAVTFFIVFFFVF